MLPAMSRICVFCSSSNHLGENYKALALELGKAMGRAGHELIYGGTQVGLMGLLANSVKEHGGLVTGVIPEKLQALGIANTQAHRLFECKDLRERKAKMDELADAFIALPGGLGTYEELLEIVNLKFLGYHNKPIILLEIDNFYKPLIDLIDFLHQERFTRESVKELFQRSECVETVLGWIDKPIKVAGPIDKYPSITQ